MKLTSVYRFAGSRETVNRKSQEHLSLDGQVREVILELLAVCVFLFL
jgi:hypothetical protein